VSNFDTRAESWDKKDRRIVNAKAIANAIKTSVMLTQKMEILDFGVGTGLLGFEIAHDVKRVYGVDTSEGMIENLKKKNTPQLTIIPLCQDIIDKPLTQKFDGIISSMTLHHIENIELLFERMYALLKTKGFIALADLEEENGTFHSDSSSVFHFGFNDKELSTIAQKSGFKDINIQTVNTISKPHGDFKVFLLTAFK